MRGSKSFITYNPCQLSLFINMNMILLVKADELLPYDRNCFVYLRNIKRYTATLTIADTDKSDEVFRQPGPKN